MTQVATHSKRPVKNLHAWSNCVSETMHLVDLLELFYWDRLAQEGQQQLKSSVNVLG